MTKMASNKPRILTGDTPTGALHLGHYVGSVKRRVELQDTYDCYFIIANMHAFTTRAEQAAEIRRDCLEIVRDHLAMGIDPNRSTIFLQTEVPAHRRADVPVCHAPALQPGDAKPDAQGRDPRPRHGRPVQLRLSALRGGADRRHPGVPRRRRAGG